MKKFFKEFKEFAFKGNVMELAIAVMIGAAFQTIVTSVSNDIISPIIGIFGGVNFDQFSLNVNGSEITYGAFITAVINFLITAIIIFIIVKIVRGITSAASKKNKEQEKAEPTKKTCPMCQSEISIKALRCPCCTSVLDDKLMEFIKKAEEE